MSKKIVTVGIGLDNDQRERLQKLGEVVEYESVNSIDDLVAKSKGADVLFSDGDFLLDSLLRLKNIFVTYPYIELGAFDSAELAKNNVLVANARGGNRDSIVEWVMYMILGLLRDFKPRVRATESFPFELKESLVDKLVLIVGHGSIGSQIGVLCEAFGMKVNFFNRGDDLLAMGKGADLIVNALNCNSTSKNLLDENFFMNMKKGAFYVTFVRPYTYDIDGLIKAIDAGIVAGAAVDCDPEGYGDTKNAFYQKALSNEKMLVTPHIAFSTKQASANGREIAVQNIEAFLAGHPQNVIEKK